MTYKILISRVVLGVFALGGMATAAYADGFSVGMSAVRAPVSVNEEGTIGGDANGWRIHGSWMFSRYFGIEGGLSKYQTPGNQSVPSNMHADTEGMDIYAVARYPFSEDGGLFAKVGYVALDTETEVNDTNEQHYRSDNLGLAFGGEYDITERIGIRAELEWFDSAISGDLKYSLGGVYRF